MEQSQISPELIRPFIWKHPLWFLLGTLFILNLIQAANTELLDDESYYWAYSRFPAWGYFDHPPMIAVMIRIGYFFFRNEFGVRLLSVIFSSFSIYIIGLLINQKNDKLFYAIIFSLVLLQLAGILAVPDTPLIFFSSLFFLTYRNFLQRITIMNTVLLGLAMSLMLYSKYQAVLIIVFTLFSNPRLLLKYKAWLSVMIAFMLYLPHVYWQYHHGFPSIKYHLFERENTPYDWTNTLNYLGGQMLIVGPLSGIIILWGALHYSPKDLLEKALKYVLAGFYIFFLLVTLKNDVEANWTLPVLIPVVVLGHQYLIKQNRLRRWVFRLLPLTLMIITAYRIYLMVDIYPKGLIGREEFHGNKRWVENIRQHSNGSPVVFLDSYQRASKYWFYSGQPSFSLNTPYYHRNNYNFWNLEDSLRGKPVYLVGVCDLSIKKPNDSLTVQQWDFPACGKLINSYYSFSNLMIRQIKNNVQLTNYSSLPVSDSHLNDQVQLYIYHGDRVLKIFSTGISLNTLMNSRPPISKFLPPDLPGGVYIVCLAIPSCVEDLPSLNSEKMFIRIP
jgi:hypothetical protein